MQTTLSPERLAELHAEGRAQAAKCRFVDPDVVAELKRLLRERGENWAASVLLRSLERRAQGRSVSHLPYLYDGEMETLILAEAAELEQLAQAAGGGA
ncbi:hypothetical protein [Nonomuraea sp. NPDC005650]|uniref:hypothetical protein n=1 Tax=Nonomuraea sp. NPDC005650 TaxID=3157045 RepID=UPI0033A87BBE